MPITTPSTVSPARSLFLAKARRATRRVRKKLMAKNAECRKSNDERNSKTKARMTNASHLRASIFVLPSTFDFRHSSLRSPGVDRRLNSNHQLVSLLQLSHHQLGILAIRKPGLHFNGPQLIPLLHPDMPPVAFFSRLGPLLGR